MSFHVISSPILPCFDVSGLCDSRLRPTLQAFHRSLEINTERLVAAPPCSHSRLQSAVNVNLKRSTGIRQIPREHGRTWMQVVLIVDHVYHVGTSIARPGRNGAHGAHAHGEEVMRRDSSKAPLMDCRCGNRWHHLCRCRWENTNGSETTLRQIRQSHLL
jgi:hypothetical protein